jgi:hypothetical protein
VRYQPDVAKARRQRGGTNLMRPRLVERVGTATNLMWPRPVERGGTNLMWPRPVERGVTLTY